MAGAIVSGCRCHVWSWQARRQGPRQGQIKKKKNHQFEELRVLLKEGRGESLRFWKADLGKSLSPRAFADS